jgi:hypothetical protein
MSSFQYNVSEVQVKGKVYPRTGHEGQDGRQIYSSSALDGRGRSIQRLDRLPPGKRTGIHFIRGWVGVRAVLNGCGKSRPLSGFDPRTAQSGASHTDCAIPVHHNVSKTTLGNFDSEYQRQHLPPKIGYKSARLYGATTRQFKSLNKREKFAIYDNYKCIRDF